MPASAAPPCTARVLGTSLYLTVPPRAARANEIWQKIWQTPRCTKDRLTRDRQAVANNGDEGGEAERSPDLVRSIRPSCGSREDSSALQARRMGTIPPPRGRSPKPAPYAAGEAIRSLARSRGTSELSMIGPLRPHATKRCTTVRCESETGRSFRARSSPNLASWVETIICR